jgi:segregation and condensation protein A
MNETVEKNQKIRDDNGYIIHIDNFDGPLDLLWELIKKSKIEIADISISPITRQYLDYLRVMETLNVRIATDFIRMASELLYYKSCALLPSTPLEDEYFVPLLPPELVQKLLEFKKFQLASRRLLVEFDANADKFTRDNRLEDIIDLDDFSELSLFDLLKAFAEVM